MEKIGNKQREIIEKTKDRNIEGKVKIS
jgi:hypothetical protein